MHIRFCSIAAAMMSAIYEEHKDEDGFLYMTYSGENTFGSFWVSQEWKFVNKTFEEKAVWELYILFDLAPVYACATVGITLLIFTQLLITVVSRLLCWKYYTVSRFMHQ